MGRYYFAKRLLEILTLDKNEPMSSNDIISYVRTYEDYLSKKQVENWLEYFSLKPSSILTKSNSGNGYFLDTLKPIHKILPEEIAPPRKKVYSKLSDFSERNQKIIKRYAKGLTLQEVGDEFAVTRERVRQIIRPAIKLGIIEKNKPHVSPKALKSMKQKGYKRRGSQQRYSERNAKIVSLVATGLSCTETGKAMCISRSTVCSVIYRHKRRKIR